MNQQQKKIIQQKNQKSQMSQQKRIITSGIQGAAVMGRTYAFVMAIISVIVAFVLFAWVGKTRKYTQLACGQISEISCIKTLNMFECTGKISYTDGKEVYVQPLHRYKSDKELQNGDMIQVYYNAKNPEEMKMRQTPFWFQVVIIIIGCLLILFSILYLVFVMKYKGLAVISGIKSVVNN